MSILDNLHRVHAAVALDKLKPAGEKKNLGENIGALAVKAITGGIKSPEWTEYMKLFANNKEQLERLTVEPPPSGESYLPQLRAYVVSNAVCASETGVFTANKVDKRINGIGVSEDVDDEFVAGRAIRIEL